MPTNIIPTQKTKLKEVIDTIEWDGTTFADRETAETQHVHKNSQFDIDVFPTIAIIHRPKQISVHDSLYNLHEDSYTIRIMTNYAGENTAQAEDILDELSSYIVDALSNYMTGSNDYWEKLSFDGGTEPYIYSDEVLAQDIRIILQTEHARTNNSL